ncbi:DUF2520 domain-containing protein [Tenacibaculum soleae]|uniref:DUF2520 domain-containing protein n=1 Tax=Tenacibaculum soleae TaxID=447689 RepID=UPI00349FB949
MEVNFNEVPFYLEVEKKNGFLNFSKISEINREKTYAINSEQRKKLNVATVFANNFINTMYQISASFYT